MGTGSLRPGLEVRVYGEKIGWLHRDRDGGTHFTPDHEWLVRDQHPPLGLAFLADPAPRVTRSGVPAWFDNLLPERNSALRTWICRQQGIRDADSGALLQALGRDLPGAVELVGEVDEVDDAMEETSLPSGIRFSLAGVQLKLSMMLTNEKFVLPARGESGQWIVKIPGQSFPDLPSVEASTMTWARATGLSVPAFHVLPIEALHGPSPALLGNPEQAFAIERFDRTATGRVHQEDFAQALDIAPAHEYGDSGKRRASYDGLARLVRDACGSDAILEFTDRIAFMIASGNGDAHLKNWSFQWGHEHRPWLSPCYDLVSTISWPSLGWDVSGGPAPALAIGQTRRFATLDRAAVRRFAERAKSPEIEGRLLAGLERARSAWPQIVGSAPARMQAALREHWQRVPILADLGGLPDS